MPKDTNSYDSPYYGDLAANTEQKLGLPVGLLSSIVTKGEKSNANQVSNAGAKTVFQVIPETRNAALKKWGVDAYLSPENAAEVAGLILKDSIKRNKGDISAAVSEYHGGLDRSNWGPITKAYTARVMAGQGAAKMDALSTGFAQFMANNPATPAPAAAEPAKDDPLSRGFGAWLESGAPSTVADQIPLDIGRTRQPQAAPVERSLGEKAVGTGEAAMTVATGAVGGTLGMIGGTVKGLAGAVMDGTFGTPQGVHQVEQSAAEGMQALTYAPRTESGQEQAGAVGDVMAATIPVMGLTAELGAAGRAASAAAAGARDLTAAPIARIKAAAPAIAERVQRTLRRNPDAPTPTPGTRGSAGSAGTDAASQRAALANDLPVPVALTEGQATRSPDQLRFELESAKGEQGGKLRDRYSEQNERLQKNFDAYADMTGAETGDIVSAGRAVDAALKAEMGKAKAKVRVAYNKADASPEANAPVILDGMVEFLNESAPDAAVSKLLVAARSRAIQLGVAAETDGGSLVPLQTTVKNAERMRRAIGQATDYEPTNIRNATIIKGAIDASTESVVGPLYKQARQLRASFGEKFERRGLAQSLLNNKKGMSDRKVAIEDIFKEVILDSDRAEVGHIGRMLKLGGEEGKQAWRELQGQTVQWLKDEATKNVATDQRGNRIVSAAQLDRALKKIDTDNKLDYIFGKKGAQQMRDINDLAKVTMTAPPGVVNTSNTASVLMAALAEAGVTGSMLGLPVPIISGLRLLAKHARDKKLRARIEHALNAPQQRRAIPQER